MTFVPGVSTDKYYHLDGWSGWWFAVDPGVVPGLSVTRQGLTLAAGELPAPGREDGRLLTEPRGLSIDPRGFPVVVSEDGSRLFVATPCGTEESIELPESEGVEGPITGVAVDRRGRLAVAFGQDEEGRNGEVRLFGFSPLRELERIGLHSSRDVDPWVSIAFDREDALHVLDAGSAEIRVLPFGRAEAGPLRVPRSSDLLAISPSGALVVGAVGGKDLWLRPAGRSSVQCLLAIRPLQPALAFGEPSAHGDEILYAGDALTGRIVEYRLACDPLDSDDWALTPLRWSTQVGKWTALHWSHGALRGLRAGRVEEIVFEPEGFHAEIASVVLGPLDAKDPQTEWHRLVAQIEPEVSDAVGIEAQVLAVDDCEAFDPTDEGIDSRWTKARHLVSLGEGRAELGLVGAIGRFAYVRLKLYGDGRRAPTMGWLRVEYPRNSYLRYLPQVFSEDPESRDLTARLLSIVEAESSVLHALIDQLHRRFRPFSAPADFLPWLAERLGFWLHPDWSTTTRREALGDLFELYRRRGTRWALERYVELYVGEKVEIVEAQRARQLFLLDLPATLGCNTVLPGSCEPVRIQLGRGCRLGESRIDSRPGAEIEAVTAGRGEIWMFVPESIARNEQRLSELRRIGELEAPAGTRVRLFSNRALRLGRVGRLGVDATLGRRDPWRLPHGDERAPDAETRLLSRPSAEGGLELGRGPRLGMDSTL